jgi:hypothetical protein
MVGESNESVTHTACIELCVESTGTQGCRRDMSIIIDLGKRESGRSWDLDGTICRYLQKKQG